MIERVLSMHQALVQPQASPQIINENNKSLYRVKLTKRAHFFLVETLQDMCLHHDVPTCLIVLELGGPGWLLESVFDQSITHLILAHGVGSYTMGSESSILTYWSFVRSERLHVDEPSFTPSSHLMVPFIH